MLARIRFGRSIASVLTVGIVLVIVLLISTMTLLDIRRERAIFRDSVEKRGILLANGLNDVLFNYLYYSDVDAVRRTAGLLTRRPDIKYVRVFRSDGSLLLALKGPYGSKYS